MPGTTEAEHGVPELSKSGQNGKWGCARISAHPCESAASTLDDHNFLVGTPIRSFLDSTERSLSLEFNNIKFSSTTWAEHWAGSCAVEEWSVLVSGTSVFRTGLYLKCLGPCMA